jgi:hypothetical protein
MSCETPSLLYSKDVASVRAHHCSPVTDISQYRLRVGLSLQYKTVFHLNCLTAQLSYEGRAAVEYF